MSLIDYHDANHVVHHKIDHDAHHHEGHHYNDVHQDIRWLAGGGQWAELRWGGAAGGGSHCEQICENLCECFLRKYTYK